MLLIGADPEVFLQDTISGRFVSAYGRFPGTKHEPVPLGDYGFMQVDGHALEFNIHAAASEDDFVRNTTTTFNLLKEVVKKHDEDLEIVLDPVATFEDGYFAQLPPESKELGCNPDYSSLTGNVLEPPDISNVPLRTSSGHIHIGWTEYEEPFDDAEFTQRLMVASKITPHLLKLSEKWEVKNSKERRKYYGKEGAFRPKHYGVELRALDCLWLAEESRMREVYRTTVDAMKQEFPLYAA